MQNSLRVSSYVRVQPMRSKIGPSPEDKLEIQNPPVDKELGDGADHQESIEPHPTGSEGSLLLDNDLRDGDAPWTQFPFVNVKMAASWILWTTSTRVRETQVKQLHHDPGVPEG